jgi:flagellin-specific chaperone FliS
MAINRNLSILAQGAGSNQTLTLTNAQANALTVGRQGTTNPVLNVDASTASVVTGLNVKGAAAAAGLALSVTSSGTNENLTLDAKGSGTITINGTATGGITLTRAVTMSSTATATAFIPSSSTVPTNGLYLPATNTTGVASNSALRFVVHTNGASVSNTGLTTAIDANLLSVRQSTANSPGLYVQNSATSGHSTNSTPVVATFSSSTPNNSTVYFLYFGDGGGERMSVRSNGGIYNFQANDSNLSDVNFKENYELLSDVSGLCASLWDEHKNARWARYKYNDQTHTDWNYGYIAQYIEEDFPTFANSLVDTLTVSSHSSEGGIASEQQVKTIYSADLQNLTAATLSLAQKRIEHLEDLVANLQQAVVRLTAE